MSQSMSAAQTMIVADKKDIIKELYNGEDRGIAATENVIMSLMMKIKNW